MIAADGNKSRSPGRQPLSNARSFVAAPVMVDALVSRASFHLAGQLRVFFVRIQRNFGFTSNERIGE
jgi:hypothetical protein